MSTKDLLVEVKGRAGCLTLNRPEALNALSYDMVIGIEKALIAWEKDPAIDLVIIEGAGDRAFCAGGDIEQMYQAGLRGDYEPGIQFWKDEYRLNAYIAEYPKPYVAFMDHFVMGGGVGISAHGSHRIVSENSKIAMPECGIGLIPDVGGTHLLAQAPGAVGEFAGLTGYRMNGADAIFMGFADSYVPGERLADLKAILCETGNTQAVQSLSFLPEEGLLSREVNEISSVFSAPSVEEVLAGVKATNEEWAKSAQKALLRHAPLSLKATLHLIRGARERRDLRQSLEHELRFVARSAEHGEFLEGIRAVIIDKDRNPKWKYPSLDAVPSDLVERMLAPLSQ